MNLVVVDRTRIEADWKCPRKRYWLTEYKGHGIVPARAAPALNLGIVVHEGLEVLTDQDGGIQAACEYIEQLEAWPLLTTEQQQLCRSLLWGFGKVVWPDWLQHFDKVAVEQELEMEHQGVVYMMRPDLLLREKTTGDLWYPDFKTYAAAWGNRKWMHALQQQLTVLACEKATGERMAGAWVQGLYKGSMRNGKLYHPLMYGYRKHGSPGLYPTQYSIKRKPGFERFPTTEFQGTAAIPTTGIEGWIEWLNVTDSSVVAGCFPRTQPIFVNHEMMQDFLRQRGEREKIIASFAERVREGVCTEQEGLDSIFPQNFSECEAQWGACPYLECCWNKQVRKDPVRSGMYTSRVPHHKMERDLLRKDTA
jgi:hypothetical protein